MTCLRTWGLLLLVGLLVSSGGCQSAYYGTMEKLGWHKRDLLVDGVKEARDDQKAAKEQFQTTLERFLAVAKTSPGEIQQRYNKLKSDYDRCESKAQEVSEQIQSVDDVANALFKEWEQELAQYSNADLKRSSEQKMRETRGRYDQLMAAMRRAEARMKPVLVAFKDQVLYLKHNLNAAAIASLSTTATTIESDVSGLIKEMEASIAEANSFIEQMK